jgi:hypothetical protein
MSAERIDFIEAKPYLGYIVHASRPHYERSGRDLSSTWNRWLRSPALCGVTGRTGSGYGGMFAVVSEADEMVRFDETIRAGNWDDGAKRVYSNRCARCTARVRALRLGAGS